MAYDYMGERDGYHIKENGIDTHLTKKVCYDMSEYYWGVIFKGQLFVRMEGTLVGVHDLDNGDLIEDAIRILKEYNKKIKHTMCRD